MDGLTLMNAAKIIEKSGEQLEVIIDLLKSKFHDVFSGDHIKFDIEWSEDDNDMTDGNWMLRSYLFTIALYETTKKKKPSQFIMIRLVLIDEMEEAVKGWEPSIYVFSVNNEDLGVESFLLSEILDKGRCLLHDTRRLWISNGSSDNSESIQWGFVIPLVKLNNEDDLVHQIVNPVNKLVKNVNDPVPFPINCKAFCYEYSGDELSILPY